MLVACPQNDNAVGWESGLVSCGTTFVLVHPSYIRAGWST